MASKPMAHNGGGCTPNASIQPQDLGNCCRKARIEEGASATGSSCPKPRRHSVDSAMGAAERHIRLRQAKLLVIKHFSAAAFAIASTPAESSASEAAGFAYTDECHVLRTSSMPIYCINRSSSSATTVRRQLRAAAIALQGVQLRAAAIALQGLQLLHEVSCYMKSAVT